MILSTFQVPTVAIAIRPAEFFIDRPAVMVASHPRAGTHFLMNALANCYGYVSSPWINLGHDQANVNYFCPPNVGDYLVALAARPLATILKAHHPADFFSGQFDRIAPRWAIIVPVRHPVDTLVSYWKHLNSLDWFEGPQLSDALEFFRSEPCGGLLRWQRRQFPNMMVRWADWTEGWWKAAQTSSAIAIVRYEELSMDFDRVMHSLAPLLGCEPQKIARPERETSEWLRPSEHVAEVAFDRDALRAACRQQIGRTMELFGYE